jgi:acetylornithine deacetylase
LLLEEGAMSVSEIQREPVWQVCRDLVAHDTVSSQSNQAAAEDLADRITSAGWQVRVHREMVEGVSKASVLAWIGPPEPHGLILSGHMDVVPWSGQPGWTGDPLQLRLVGDRAVGRGVADMKGFLAQCVVLAGAIDADRLQRPVVMVLTCDEELGCTGAGRLVRRLPELVRVPLPSLAVIGEPTSWRLFVAHKGHVRCTIHVRGHGGHSSRPDTGVNAISVMADVVLALRATTERWRERVRPRDVELFPEYPFAALNPGLIHGGTAINMIAEQCDLDIGFRCGPDDDPEGLLNELKAAATEAVSGSPGATVAFHDVVITPGMASPADGPVVEALEAIGTEGPYRGAPFATDGGQLATVGVRSYIWGPGELEQAHQPDESMPIAHLLEGPDLLAQLVDLLCARS